MTITPSQCRGARAMLGWTQGQLARAAKIPHPVLITFEREKRYLEPHTLSLVERILEEAGIVFIAENGGGPGVRLKLQLDLRDHPEPDGSTTKVVKQMDADGREDVKKRVAMTIVEQTVREAGR